ncbi:DnaB-like helicase N-terminal domain-containing protein [Streptosporangium canum]|uniref:DnaB-like helicase N-terminal domain-containing protein n=1 Tax=Streptosporangium canum TaxID=324952 RepID=UPI0036A58BBB
MHVERALLGSLLRDPRQLRQLQHLTKIEPGDFGDSDHVRLMKAIVEETGKHDLDTIDGWNALRQALEDFATSIGHDGVWLEEMAAASPDPTQSVHYAVMVLEGDTRRVIAHHAQRLIEAMATKTPAVETVDEHLAATRKVLSQLATRWKVDPSARSDTTPALTTPNAATAARNQPTADQSTQPSAGSLLQRGLTALRAPFQERLGGVTHNAEDRLLASLVADPGQIAEVGGWLQAEDFTTPARAELYTAIVALDQRGEPLDAITVVFEASRDTLISSRQADRFIARCHKASPGQAVALARDLVEKDIAAYVQREAKRIVTSVTSTNARPPEAIATALAALDSLDGQAERWRASRRVTASDTMTYQPPAAAYALPSIDPAAAAGTEPNARTSL